MTEINSQNIESAPIEKGIAKLSQEIAEKRNLPEHKDLSEKELIKQVLQPIVKSAADQASQPASTPQKSEDDKYLPDYLKEAAPDVKAKVEDLLNTAFKHGIVKSVDEARQAGPFVLDAFHDALTDKLYEELKKRNLI